MSVVISRQQGLDFAGRARCHAFIFAASLVLAPGLLTMLMDGGDLSNFASNLHYAMTAFALPFYFTGEFIMKILFIPAFFLYIWLLSCALMYFRKRPQKWLRVSGQLAAFLVFALPYAALFYLLIRALSTAAFLMIM